MIALNSERMTIQETAPDPDRELARRAVTDPAAFAALYRHYADPIYRYCYARLGNRESAEDITQIVFEKAQTGLPRFRQDGHFRAWLFTIAHHSLTDFYRTRRPVSVLEDDPPIPDPDRSPEELVIQRDDASRIRALLTHLTDGERQVVELRLAGLSDGEIASVLGRNPAAVRAMQHRALIHLRALLGVGPDTRGEPGHV